MTTERAGFPWILTVACAAALALLIGLGAWQVRRLAWKEGLIAQAQAAGLAAPVPLADLAALPDPEFRRVVLPCDFQNRPHVELQSIHDGQPGVRLIAACEGWLVDLGFVPETISARPARASAAIPGITAVVRRTDPPGAFSPPPRNGRFFARDAEVMSGALGVEAARPFTLYAEESAWPQWAALTPSPPPPAFSNNHLGYALTWFGLAIVLIGFYVALLRRRLRKSAS